MKLSFGFVEYRDFYSPHYLDLSFKAFTDLRKSIVKSSNFALQGIVLGVFHTPAASTVFQISISGALQTQFCVDF